MKRGLEAPIFNPVPKYLIEFCLNWWQFLNAWFCKGIDSKDNVISVVSMTTDMLHGTYPSCIVLNHLVSNSLVKTL